MATTASRTTRTEQRKAQRAKEMAAFGESLASAMKARGCSQVEMAERLGATQSMVSVWRNGEYECPHDVVFEMERILNLKPGTLSIRFGYLPPQAVRYGASTVMDAVLADDLLSEVNKHTVLALYDHLVEAEAPSRAKKRAATRPKPRTNGAAGKVRSRS